MKKWMKKMAIIGAVLFVGGIGVTSIGAAIGGAAAGLDFLIDQEKNFQDKYNWGDSEEIWDDTEQLLFHLIRLVVGFPTQCTDLRNGVEIEGCSTDFSNRRASNRIVFGMTDRHGDVHLKDGHIHLVPK